MFSHNITVLAVPGEPDVGVTNIEATSISLFWSVPSGTVVTSYKIEWERDTSADCPVPHQNSSIIYSSFTTAHYDVVGLEEGSVYTFRVIAYNKAGTSEGKIADTTKPDSEDKI